MEKEKNPQKSEEKKPKKKVLNIQERVLFEIWRSRRDVSTKDLMDAKDMTYNQVIRAIYHLKNRGLIKIEKEDYKIGYKKPPSGILKICVNDKSVQRIKELTKI